MNCVALTSARRVTEFVRIGGGEGVDFDATNAVCSCWPVGVCIGIW